MPKQGKFILGVISVLAFVVSLGAVVYANHFGVSQFVVIRGAGEFNGRPRVMNPTKFPLFAVAIHYGSGEDFDYCESTILSPHDRDTFGTKDSFNSGMVEIIAGIGGQQIAAINHAVGIVVDAKRRQSRPLDPAIFSVTDPDAIDCVCQELADNGQSSRFFSRFGVKCPA